MQGKQQPRFRLDGWVVAFVVAGILFLGVVFFFRPAPSGAGPEKGSNSSSATSDGSYDPSTGPTPTVPPNITNSTDNTEPDIPVISPDDCRNSMSSTQYSSFIERLVSYERLRVQPDTSKKQEQIVSYVTQRYLDDHSGKYNEVDTTVVKIDSATTRCQVKTDGTLIGVVIPVISTYEADGTAKNLGITTPAHYTNWVKVNGKWYVNQEQE